MNGDTDMNIGMTLSVWLFVIGAIGALFIAVSASSLILFLAILLAVSVSSLYLYYISATAQRLQDLSQEFMRYERACEKREERHAEEMQVLLKKLIELKEQEMSMLHSMNNQIADTERAAVECVQTREDKSDVQEPCAKEEEPKQEKTSVEIDAVLEEPNEEVPAVVEPEAKADEKQEEILSEEESVEQQANPNVPDVDCTSNLKRVTKEDLERGFVYNKSSDKALDLLRKGWRK